MYSHLSQVRWLSWAKKMWTFCFHVPRLLTNRPLLSYPFQPWLSRLDQSDRRGVDSIATTMRNPKRRDVRGRSTIPIYFLGGRKVGTVWRMKVGGKVGLVSAWRLSMVSSAARANSPTHTIAAFTARWLIWPLTPPESNVMT